MDVKDYMCKYLWREVGCKNQGGVKMEIGNAYAGYSASRQNMAESKLMTVNNGEAEQVKNETDKGLTGTDYLRNLEKEIPDTSFFTGTVSYGQTYGNRYDVNFVVNPQFLGKLGTDEEATKRFYEDVKYLDQFAKRQRESLAASGWEVVSQGWFCDENGNWGGWCVTRKTDKKSYLETFSENTDKINQKKLEQKRESGRKEKAAEKREMKEKVLNELKERAGIRLDRYYVYDENESGAYAYGQNKGDTSNDPVRAYDTMQHVSGRAKYKNQDDIYVTASDNAIKDSSVLVAGNQTVFGSTKELMQYLSHTYDTVRMGMVKISGSYLRECLSDENKRQELFESLESADVMAKHAEENVKGYQGMKITIDKEGKIETETHGGSITFNESKRARQLAAAKTPANVRMVLNLLAKDLSDCENGLRNGMCDENEVAKVKTMIAKAKQRMREVSSSDNHSNEEGIDTFSINLLL